MKAWPCTPIDPDLDLGSWLDFGPPMPHLPVSGNHWAVALWALAVSYGNCPWLLSPDQILTCWLNVSAWPWICFVTIGLSGDQDCWLNLLSASQTLIFISVCDVGGCYYLCFEDKETLMSNVLLALLILASILKYLRPDFSGVIIIVSRLLIITLTCYLISFNGERSEFPQTRTRISH